MTPAQALALSLEYVADPASEALPVATADDCSADARTDDDNGMPASSRQQLEAFGEQLMPILADIGIEFSSEPEVFEVHNLVTN